MTMRSTSFVLAALVGLGGTAQAQMPDPVDGQRLAALWCASCHRVGAEPTGSDAARAFAAIARDPNFTEDGVRAWLAAPHPPMPDLSLTRQEIEAIVAYLRALRRE